MIGIFTNCKGFLNDIAEEARLFFDMTSVVPVGEDFKPNGDDVFLSIVLCEEGNTWKTRAVCKTTSNAADYVYEMPALDKSALIQKRYKKRCVKIAAFRVMKKLFSAFLPWGSLTGIRPTRLLRELEADAGDAEAKRIMLYDFDVSEGKYKLASDIVKVQAPILEEEGNKDIGVYIGIPFCTTRCLYCSFASAVRTKNTDMEAYLAALKRDIGDGARLVREGGYRVRSVYVGGGTPTVLDEGELYALMSHAQKAYGGFGKELTVEAGRPDTITREKLQILRDFGAKRISVNPQSMNEITLARIGRNHAPKDIESAFALVRELGFASVNMDVIAGLPGEDARDFERTLEAVTRLLPDNLTVHTLAVKRASKLKLALDEYALVSAQTADEMVQRGAQAAYGMGMRPYYMYRQKYMRGNLENVGYALPDKECIYNIDMMEETTGIMGHGAGAMSKRVFDGEHRVERIPNPKDVSAYIGKLDAVFAQKADLFLDGRTGKLTY